MFPNDISTAPEIEIQISHNSKINSPRIDLRIIIMRPGIGIALAFDEIRQVTNLQ